MIQAAAIYFDGISSRPQPVNLVLDSANSILVIHHDDSKISRWKTNEISIDQIGNSMEIRYSDNSQQLLKVTDKAFVKALKSLLKEKGRFGWYERLLEMGPRVHLSLAVIILGIIALVYYFALPKIAEKAVVLIPESYDNTMGESFYNEYVNYSSIDSAKTNALNQFARQLKLNNTKELKFTVVNSEVINAFALPDGNIVVFTGIIDLMQNYGELASLICHETIHVNERHSMKMLCRNLAGYLFLSVVISDVNSILTIIGDNLHSLQSLTYSRQFEKEADLKGFELLIQNNIDPKGMANLFQRLQQDSDKLLPEFASSHPITENRINYINKLIKKNIPNSIENPVLEEYFNQIKSE